MPRKLSLQDLDLQPLACGLVGLVDGIAQIMHHVAAATGEALQVAGAASPDELRDELACISGAAFAHYVYEPSYNLHEDPPRRYSALSDLFCNYGAFESLAYYTGWQVQEVNGLSADDLWELVRFEIGGGRPLLTVVATAATAAPAAAEATEAAEAAEAQTPMRPTIVTGYQEGPGLRILELTRGEAVEQVEVTHLKNLQDPEEAFHNWVVFTRPGQPPEWAASEDRQRMGLLRWLLKHAHNTKEFFHETRENYAPGLHAYDSFLGLLRGLPDDPPDAALASWVEEHVAFLRAGRAAASRVLPRWGVCLAERLQAPEVAEALGAAAAAYAEAAEALGQGPDTGLLEAVTAAQDAERRAVAAIESVEDRLPRAFGTL